MSEHESISQSYESTAIMPEGYCPLCSSKFSFIYHHGRCPQVKAKEYFPDGRLKRIEFCEPSQVNARCVCPLCGQGHDPKLIGDGGGGKDG